MTLCLMVTKQGQSQTTGLHLSVVHSIFNESNYMIIRKHSKVVAIREWIIIIDFQLK